MNSHNVKVAQKPFQTLGHIFAKPKDPGLNVFLSKHLLNKMTAKGLLSHCLNPVQNVTRGTEALRQKLFHFMVRPSTFVPVKVFLADQIFFFARGYDLG